MSSQAPERSPLDQARAETNELIHKVQDDLESLRTAPVNELETRIDSLNNSFKFSQESIIANVESALGISETHSRDLEQSLQAEKKRLDALTSELSSQKQEAQTKHSQLTVELASLKINHGLTKHGLDKAKKELEEASQRTTGLEKDLQAVKQQNVDLQAEVDSAKRQPADLQERLKAVEQQVADLEADRKAATQRASTAEDELKTLKSHFKQISHITALVFPSEVQLTGAQPAFSSAQVPTKQGSMDEGKDGPQLHNHHFQAESLDPRMAGSTSDPEPDMLLCRTILNEVMDKKWWQYNRHFLKPLVAGPTHRPAGSMGLMNLNTMKEKLAEGAYTSGNSFRADFDLMIADCRRLESLDNTVHIAAGELAKIFEQAWSTHHTSGHKSADDTSSTQETINRKRKAETEGLVSSEDGHVEKRRSLGPLEQDISHFQPVNPDIGESLSPGLSSSDQSKDTANDTAKDDTYAIQLTTGTRLDIVTSLEVVPKFVSVIKSPNTLPGGWESLIPDECRITAHSVPSTVEKRLDEVEATLSSDMAVIRLMPASDADKPDFDHLLDYLFTNKRYATVSHAGMDKVQGIYLIPTSKLAPCPSFRLSLDRKLLPPPKTEDVLFMVVIFRLTDDMHKQVRQAWDGLIKATHNLDIKGLAAMHDHLLHHRLPVFRPRLSALSRAPRDLAILNRIPCCQEILQPDLQALHPNVIRLSSSFPGRAAILRVDGVQVPERLFVLGRVISSGPRFDGHLVVDIQHSDRPLWYLWGSNKARRGLFKSLTLLRSKFPASLSEWEDTLLAGLRKTQQQKCLCQVGLKIERYRLPQSAL